MYDSQQPTDRPRHSDHTETVIETTIPAKKPAPDLPTDEFFEKTSYRPIHPTGDETYDLAGRVEGVHVLGILHGHQPTIDRLMSALRQYDPDIVAVEACPQAILQHHPSRRTPEWPPEHEVEAAAYAARHTDTLSITGIDTVSQVMTTSEKKQVGQADAEIFADLGLLETPDDLTRDTYYELNFELIREWRDRTQARLPDLFERVLATRDDAMAGRLYELYHQDEVETVVAAVGIQHLTGILDRLQAPSLIPDSQFEQPRVYTYNPAELNGEFLHQ